MGAWMDSTFLSTTGASVICLQRYVRQRVSAQRKVAWCKRIERVPSIASPKQVMRNAVKAYIIASRYGTVVL